MSKAKIVILVTLVLISCVIIGYYLLTKTTWPIVFQLTNTGASDIQIPVYINGEANQGSPVVVPAGKSVSVTLGATNPRTNQPYTAKQTKNVSIYLTNGQTVKYTPVNVPKASWVLAPNISGLAPSNTNPGTTWSTAGYYVATFS